jgi:hypothetical protein
MTGDKVQKGPHPAFRALSWGLPLAALAVIAALLIFGDDGGEEGTMVSPPSRAGIPYVGFAEIDSIIAGGADAFEKGDYDGSAALLARARFFIASGIREGRFAGMPRNLELILGLSQYYRGYPEKGIEMVMGAAEAEPRSEICSWYLGRMLLSEGDAEGARKYLERTAALGGMYSESAKTILEGM